MIDQIFHEGEKLVQERAGERAIALLNGRNIAMQIPAAARLFVTQQQAAILAWEDEHGQLWSRLIFGAQGFIVPSDNLTALTLTIPADAYEQIARLPIHHPVGILLLEFATRRRLRVNGTILRNYENELEIAVAEGFPNCPKYIHKRHFHDDAEQAVWNVHQAGTSMDATVRQIINNADTFFVASRHPERGTDASHRGGNVGFVKIREDSLFVPDYHGNSMFNTLGNFASYPKAGLSFVDFEKGFQLQMSGDVILHFDVVEDQELTGGTGRWWEFRTQEWNLIPFHSTIKWKYIEASPFNP